MQKKIILFFIILLIVSFLILSYKKIDNNLKYQKVFLYFYNPNLDKDENANILCSENGLVKIEREIPLTQTPIKDTLNLLLKGKEILTQTEIEKGIQTEFPLKGFYLKSLNLKPDGTLVVEFKDELNLSSGGSCRSKILYLQIEKTLSQFKEIKKVEFLPNNLFQP